MAAKPWAAPRSGAGGLAGFECVSGNGPRASAETMQACRCACQRAGKAKFGLPAIFLSVSLYSALPQLIPSNEKLAKPLIGSTPARKLWDLA
jgi:hypothetical protein